jgi:hypothetical protein
MDDPGEANERPLQHGLDVDPKASLEHDDPLAVTAGPFPSIGPEHECPHEHVHGVDTERDGDLPSERERPHAFIHVIG